MSPTDYFIFILHITQKLSMCIVMDLFRQPTLLLLHYWKLWSTLLSAAMYVLVAILLEFIVKFLLLKLIQYSMFNVRAINGRYSVRDILKILPSWDS